MKTSGTVIINGVSLFILNSVLFVASLAPDFNKISLHLSLLQLVATAYLIVAQNIFSVPYPCLVSLQVDAE